MSQLLKLNKYEHTSYRLDSSQLKYYNLFFNQVNFNKYILCITL